MVTIQKCNGEDAQFLFKIGQSQDVKKMFLKFEWNSELLEQRA